MANREKDLILLACGINRKTIVMATNSSAVAHGVYEIANDAADLGIGDATSVGFWLWEGYMIVDGVQIGPNEWEGGISYKGTMQKVWGDELAFLMAMLPPPEPEDIHD